MTNTLKLSSQQVLALAKTVLATDVAALEVRADHYYPLDWVWSVGKKQPSYSVYDLEFTDETWSGSGCASADWYLIWGYSPQSGFVKTDSIRPEFSHLVVAHYRYRNNPVEVSTSAEVTVYEL